MKQHLNRWSAWLLIVSLVVSLFAAGAGQASASDPSNGSPAGYVTLSVEKFTLGQGYYREPVKVPFYAGDNGAALLTRALGTDNIRNTGSIDSAFYLSKVKDADSEVHIPQYIVDQIEADGQQLEGKKDPDWLGEFDYTGMSGWLYEVNDDFPPYGFTDYAPQDGDVIRTQFSVYGYGADLDTSWGYGFMDTADKDDLTAAVAELNSRADKSALLADSGVKAAYDQAYAVLTNLESDQASVDAALLGLDAELAKDRTKPVIAVQGLTDNQDVANALLAFTVSVTDNADTHLIAEVKLNGTVVAESAAGGQYSIQLNEGSNTIAISAADTAGNRAEQIFNVQYRTLATRANEHLNKSLAYMVKTVPNPTFGTLGGEWSVLSLARANYPVPAGYYDNYYRNVETQVTSLMTKNGGLLDKNKSTEHSRLLLGLSAIGKDSRNVAGYDITQALADYDYVLKQGNNGPIFALIGMDTYGYLFPEAAQGKTQATREKLIAYILDKEVKKGTVEAGGWALGVTKADVDMTAMAIQSLAPYYNTNADVKAAVDRAVLWLSQAQNAAGAYSSYGSTSSESLAQVVTALSEIGIDAGADPRFVKNGISALDALMTFAGADGGFKHVLTGKVDGMATDQGVYALVAYSRMKQGAARLYDMTDVMPQQAREVKVVVPAEDTPHIAIPQDNAHDFIVPITAGDAGKSITVDIPADTNSLIQFSLPSNTALPQLEAVKGSVSAVIPQGAQVVSGDAAKLQWLTNVNVSSDALAAQVGSIVAQGTKLDSVDAAVTMGGSAAVEFDKYVTLTFQGMSGKQAAYIHNGTAYAITKYATDAEGEATGSSEYAYDSGSDLIVKTKHFTDFAAYTSSVASNPGTDPGTDPGTGNGGTTPGTDPGTGNGGTTPEGGGTGTKSYVTLSVDKLTIGKGHVISPEQVELQTGDTVWSVLQRQLASKSIAFEYEWSSQYDSVYVQSIAGDGEFDHGSGSGWMYNVNGIYPNYGASKYVLKNGDNIQWRYTTDLGNDLGNPYIPSNPGAGGTGGTGGSGGTPANPNGQTPGQEQTEQPGGKEGAATDLSKVYSDAGDVSAWAYESVARATQLGLLQGSGGKLKPKSTITRAEFTKLLVTALHLDTSSVKASGYQDVAQGQWFYPYVAAANDAGLITGYGGKFNPGDTITREQMAVMIVRAFGLQSNAAAPSLQDLNKVSSWASSAVNTVVSLGLMVGQNGRFQPADAVTREMAAVVAIRAIELLGSKESSDAQTPLPAAA